MQRISIRRTSLRAMTVLPPLLSFGHQLCIMTTLVTDMRGRSIVLQAWRRKEESERNVDGDLNLNGASKDKSKGSSIKGSLDQDTAVIVQRLQATSSKSPPPQHMSALEMQAPQQQEHGKMQWEVRKTSSRRLSSDTSVTYASSSGSSDSHVSDGRSEKDDSNEIGAHNSYTDEILARNMTISFEQKTVRDVKPTPSSLTIPFLDYLEKQMSKLNEESGNCVAAISPKSKHTMHLELSPTACQSAAAAEEKTIQCLRREVLSLHLALGTLKKNSHAWILLNSILDDARVELNAVLEDQELVRSFETVNTW